ncbi:F-box/kelch-repeat protein At3g06240-like [Vicia villosa]|uniref:F-box/kelch-repeat protein At3g06240-like n=1 Tax=Vicia villosa TaxID=3911 RepID=UPI00273C7C17|nr:F-box/kelch-repeat protein At3g06240-like [Vicia villosa]
MEKRVSVVATNKTTKVRKELHIHHDIAFSILSKLSIKSLKRFECVCKSWSLLSDNHYFMRTYRESLFTKYHSYYDDACVLLHPLYNSYHNHRFGLYPLYDERFVSNVKIDKPYCDCGFSILGSGSVHGIFCLSFIYEKDIILWNPCTKEFKLIPRGINHRKCYQNGYLNWGFGYDSVDDDYKVTCIYQPPVEDEEVYCEPLVCEIYSLRNNFWKKFDVDKKHSLNFWSNEQVYINGLSHRVCKVATHKCNESYVLSFDWHREVFTTTPIPFDIEDIIDFLNGWRHLVLLNGSTALILNSTRTSTFHIYILGEFGVKESWTKIFTIESFPNLKYPIGMGKRSDMLLKKKDGGLVWFDLVTQKITDLNITTKNVSCNILIHKENPISLVAYQGKSI